MTMFHRADPRSTKTAADVRLSREMSILLIGALSALSWAIVIFTTIKLWRMF